MHYVVYAQQAITLGSDTYRAGQVVSEGTVVAEGLPNAIFGVVPYEVRPDPRAFMWDEAQRMFVPRPPAPAGREISKRAFMFRLPGPMRRFLIELRDNAAHPLSTPAIRAALTDATESRDMVRNVNLDDPAVIEYVPFATNLLVAGGFVPAGEATAFAANWRRDAGPGEAAQAGED